MSTKVTKLPDLLFEQENGIAILTLNRPDSLNAFSVEMIEKWVDSLERVRDDESIRVLVITGNGKAFCAGGDLKALKKGDGFLDKQGHEELNLWGTGLDRKNSLWKYVQRIPLLMEEIDKPTIAAINGDAIGAGLDMALQCDLRFAADSARLGEGYIKLGLVPGDGGGYFLPRIIGLDKALEMLWTGDIISAEKALEIGLVTRVIEKDQLMDETMAFAERLANGPQQAIRLIKRTVISGQKMDLRSSLDQVSSFMGLVTEHEDYQEGIRAILEKRKPVFK